MRKRARARGVGGRQPRVVGLGVVCAVGVWARHLAPDFDKKAVNHEEAEEGEEEEEERLM